VKREKTGFETLYRDLLRELNKIDYLARAAVLGLEPQHNALKVVFYGSPYRVSSRGVTDLSGKDINFAVGAVICKYILFSPKTVPCGEELISFREFDGAGPLTGYFIENTQKIIESAFSGGMDRLKHACRDMGGISNIHDASYDVSVRFDALPRVPIYLRYNDRDEMFPAQCSILFKQTAEQFLDLESLGILGTFLVGNLIQP